MEVSVANPTAETRRQMEGQANQIWSFFVILNSIGIPSLSSPLRIGRDGHFTARIALCVVDVELQLPSFVSLHQRE